jgi:ketopantoate reductase
VSEIVVWGMGELGGVFARGLLRTGHTVVPVLRDTDVEALAARVPAPALVLVAVGEAALPGVLARVPAAWRARVALLQNELRPRDWQRHGLDAPTLAVVWFEKKRGGDARVLLPTPIAGPGTSLLVAALASLGLAAEHVAYDDALAALAAKNLYILTTNLAGLRVGGDVGTLVTTHRALVDALVPELLALESALFAPHPVEHAAARAVLERACAADPRHACAGRSAPDRLARTLAHVDALGLALPTLRALAVPASPAL